MSLYDNITYMYLINYVFSMNIPPLNFEQQNHIIISFINSIHSLIPLKLFTHLHNNTSTLIYSISIV